VNVGDVFFSLRGDGGPLMVDAQKAGEAAALAGGKTFNQTFGASLKKAAGGFAGAGLGLAFASATSGALELNAATAEFTAQTGASDAEAKKFTATLAALNKSNVQSIPEIGAALTALTLNFKLTGDAAKGLGAQFLDFSRIAGGTAAESVGRFDELVDAGVITADQMAVTMDKLTASHQKFGVDINGTIGALVKFAPAMTAAGISTDDAIGLMNMFSESGLNAEAASKAFNIALGKVKSPEELQRLIADISSTEDPFLRAQLAADLFGKRAGVQLANALKPGSGGIEAWTVTMTEAAGATTKAGDALDASFGNQAKLRLKEINGTLAEMGTNMGDLLMVAALLGPGLTRGLLTGLGGLAGLLGPKIVAAVLATGPGAAIAGSGVGAMIGTAMAAALPLALVAAAGIGIALAFKSIVLDPGLQEQSKAIGTAVGKQIATGTTEELEQSKAALEKGIADINAIPFGGFLYGDQVRDLETQLAAVNDKLLAGGADMPASLAAGIDAGAGPVEVAVADLVSTFGTSLRGVVLASRATGADGMSAMAAAIGAARQKPLDAFETLKKLMKESLTPTAEVARLAGGMMSKELARGLRDSRPDVRAQALATAQETALRLGEIAKAGGPAGKAALSALSAGIRSKIPEVSAASLEARRAAVAVLNGTKTPAAAAGTAAGNSFAAALRAAVAAGDFHVNASVGFTIPGKAAGGPIVGPSWVGERGPEIYVPSRPGQIISHEEAMATVAGRTGAASSPVTVNVYNPKPEPASTSTERELRKLAYLGVVG
jgi:hypothetical protein